MEPEYTVPCRATITAQMDRMYTTVREEVSRVVALQHDGTLTSDMWTPCNSSEYTPLAIVSRQ